ncbi:MAG TPA: DUF2892 domain-containing protein [Natrialbaceae archaeon]|nr:DUF2892 domain-containing protein [Natrialbaceae archaeon]
MIEVNVGGTDRLLRFGFGAIALFVGVAVVTLLARPVVGSLLILTGAILLTTGLARRCPINRALDLDTHRDE